MTGRGRGGRWHRVSEQVRRRWKGRIQRNAEAAILPLRRGDALYGLTDGSWSMLEALHAILQATGPAHVGITTWRCGRADGVELAALRDSGRLRSIRIVLDRSVFALDRTSIAAGGEPILATVRRYLGDEAIRLWTGHAKYMTVRGDRLAVLWMSSMNLNRAVRAESWHVLVSDEIVALHEAPIAELFAAPPELGEVVQTPDGAVRREEASRDRTARLLGSDAQWDDADLAVVGLRPDGKKGIQDRLLGVGEAARKVGI